MWKLSRCRAGKREHGLPNEAVVIQESLCKSFTWDRSVLLLFHLSLLLQGISEDQRGVPVSLIPKRILVSSLLSCVDCCLEALVFANSDAPPFSFIKRRTVSASFPWQNPRSTADNTTILELSICYLRCMHACTTVHRSTFPLLILWPSFMNCWEKTDVAQWDSSLLTLSVFSCYIQISKSRNKKKKKKCNSR